MMHYYTILQFNFLICIATDRQKNPESDNDNSKTGIHIIILSGIEYLKLPVKPPSPSPSPIPNPIPSTSLSTSILALVLLVLVLILVLVLVLVQALRRATYKRYTRDSPFLYNNNYIYV